MALEKPAPTGDVFDVSSHVGALLVLEPLEDVPPMVTKASKDPQPAVRANIYVVTPPGQVSEEYHGALLFQKLLWQRLRQSIGKQVCGILTGSPGQVVNGRNVPYDLADPPDAAFEAASRAMMGRPQSQPATGQQGPWGGPSSGTAPAPWQQPAQQPQAPWGQPPAQQGPPPAQAGPWGSAPAPDQQWGQQQIPAPQQPAGPPPGWGQQPPAPPQDESVPPWERQQPAQAPAGWGAQQ
jgi:hypothetical protein